MARRSRTGGPSNWVILLADDDPDYSQTTRILLEREGHRVVMAEDGPAALKVLREQHIDLVLLDYFMPGMTGEDVVVELRKFNPQVQVVLQTGYASEQPPRELLQRLDIQGFHDKSEGPDKLLMWADIGLKAAYTVQLLNKSRQGLRYILNVTPDLHKIQPLDQLLQGIMFQVEGLIGASNSFLAVIPQNVPSHSATEENPEGFVAIVEDDTELVIHASTGRFVGNTNVNECLDPAALNLVISTLNKPQIQIIEATTIVPLCVGSTVMGVVYLDRSVTLRGDIELLEVFANQAAVAIQNSQLYEIATLDPLTGVYVRRFFEQSVMRELRAAFRSKRPISLLMIDMDGLKHINDTAGHLVGDQALALLGTMLNKSLRDSDIAGRYGGDEFAVLLSNAGAEGAQVTAQRILDVLQGKTVEGPDGELAVEGSIGIAVLQPHDWSDRDIPRPMPSSYFPAMLQYMITHADTALYQAKRSGGSRMFTTLEMLEWKKIQ